MKPRHKEFLQGFLYTLMRDYVPIEDVAQLIRDAEEHPPPYEFTNTHLAEIAEEFAQRLLTDAEANRVNKENLDKALAHASEVCRQISRGEYEQEVAVEDGCRIYWVKESKLAEALKNGARRVR
jgi:hypothetical protein